MGTFPCRGIGCSRELTNPNGQTRHRNKCDFYKLSQAASAARAREALAKTRCTRSGTSAMDCDMPPAAIATPPSPAPPPLALPPSVTLNGKQTPSLPPYPHRSIAISKPHRATHARDPPLAQSTTPQLCCRAKA
ncbi:hypothetical protein FIBSPDRAFT_196442 [Athelia psychrophila]|uniref:Uncharacterized protein n=1 Tax=Athelia psychrophila TaxID=1759441 RepID=A0A165ZVZ4_9AGAM|nr:hypothetical protein FIBSPDRAFT_196442 [Fibularhizoctonia sp. CBS 109695]